MIHSSQSRREREGYHQPCIVKTKDSNNFYLQYIEIKVVREGERERMEAREDI